jgi:uncharacterized protein (DUF305 family)
MNTEYLFRFAGPAALALTIAAAPAFAQQQGHGHGSMPMDPASRAYMESMGTMDRGMKANPMTGDADRDFATMMIAHHQGAIDMARVELEHGKDPQMQGMARKIIDDQTREIAELKDWLGKHPGR